MTWTNGLVAFLDNLSILEYGAMARFFMSAQASLRMLHQWEEYNGRYSRSCRTWCLRIPKNSQYYWRTKSKLHAKDLLALAVEGDFSINNSAADKTALLRRAIYPAHLRSGDERESIGVPSRINFKLWLYPTPYIRLLISDCLYPTACIRLLISDSWRSDKCHQSYEWIANLTLKELMTSLPTLDVKLTTSVR